MDKYQEMRTILSGKVNFVNGAYTAAPSLWKAGFVGMFSGSDAARILGVRRMTRAYQSGSVDAGIHIARNIFEKLGRPTYFQSEPTLQACFLRNYMGNPVILTLGEFSEGIRIDAYTARTLLSGLSLSYAFRLFEKHLPDDMRAAVLPEEIRQEGSREAEEEKTSPPEEGKRGRKRKKKRRKGGRRLQ